MIEGAIRLAKSSLALVVVVTVITLPACSSDEPMTASEPAATGASRPDEEELPVRQWYPRPKTVVGPAFTHGVPAVQQQFPTLQQPATQSAPASGGQHAGQQNWQPSVPAYGSWQQQTVAQPWGQQVPQVQPQAYPAWPQYQVQPAWSQYQVQPAWPQQGGATVQPQMAPVYPQQYQYVQPPPMQDPYTYRPWGAANTDENSSSDRNTMHTWQTGNPPPAWGGMPAYSTVPAQTVPQYGGYQVGTPGYVW